MNYTKQLKKKGKPHKELLHFTQLMFLTFFILQNPVTFVVTEHNKDSKKTSICDVTTEFKRSTSKTVEGSSLPLQRIHNVHGRNRLPPGVLGIGHSVANHILQEYLEHSPRLLVNQSTDPLHTTSSRQSPNCRFRYALNVVAKHFPVPLRTSLAQSLSSLPSTRHFLNTFPRRIDPISGFRVFF